METRKIINLDIELSHFKIFESFFNYNIAPVYGIPYKEVEKTRKKLVEGKLDLTKAVGGICKTNLFFWATPSDKLFFLLPLSQPCFEKNYPSHGIADNLKILLGLYSIGNDSLIEIRIPKSLLLDKFKPTLLCNPGVAYFCPACDIYDWGKALNLNTFEIHSTIGG